MTAPDGRRGGKSRMHGAPAAVYGFWRRLVIELPRYLFCFNNENKQFRVQPSELSKSPAPEQLFESFARSEDRAARRAQTRPARPFGPGEYELRIATRGPKGHKPIQIRAEALRHWKPPVPYDPGQGFAAMPDDRMSDPTNGETPHESDWSDAALKRAIAAAEKSGLRDYRVEIAPDGTISIIVGAQPGTH